MAEFTSNMQNFKSPLSFLEHDIETMNQFSQLNPFGMDPANLNFQNFMGFSIENFMTQQLPEFPGNLADNFPGIFHGVESNTTTNSPPPQSEMQKSKKRIAIHELDSSSGNSSPQASDSGNRKKTNSGRGKRLKNSEEEEKPKDVVHVRARRGQATDSHSLAERVRRGKINERLKCLQDIVPGCHKTMGMAVMLDEIINYVQSLQNQVDFLSMKLTAASTFHDFNSETDALETLQRAKAYEAQKMQRIVRRGYEEVGSIQFGSLDSTFGSYPSLPYNT